MTYFCLKISGFGMVDSFFVVKMSLCFILPQLEVGDVCLMGKASPADATGMKHRMQCVWGVWSITIGHAGTKHFIPPGLAIHSKL